MATQSSFEPLFDRWAARVRRRLALRHILTGAALGALVALVPAGIAWKLRHGKLRPYAALTVAGGVIAGAAIARRKRWTDESVALYLDGELQTEEAISTAVEIESAPPDSEGDPAMRAVVIQSAATALGSGDRKHAKPTFLRPVHLLLPLGLAGVAFITHAPLPPAPIVAFDPGTAKIQIAEVEGLEKIIKLAQLDPRDEAQRERLDKIAKDAEKLKEESDEGNGEARRARQDREAEGADRRGAIDARRRARSVRVSRARCRSSKRTTRRSARRRRSAITISNRWTRRWRSSRTRARKQDRDLAKKSVQDAADAAKQNGAPGVAKALEDEKKAMEKREKRAEELRDLADSMKKEGIKNDDVENKSEALDRKGTDEAAKKLADAMGKALDKLTPEEKKRLADACAKKRRRAAGRADAEDMKDMADRALDAEGQKKLEDS